MKPIKFKEVNKTLESPIPGDVSLPCFIAKFPPLNGNGEYTIAYTCWKMSLRERISALIFGKVWLSFRGITCPPIFITAKKNGFEYEKEKKI